MEVAAGTTISMVQEECRVCYGTRLRRRRRGKGEYDREFNGCLQVEEASECANVRRGGLRLYWWLQPVLQGANETASMTLSVQIYHRPLRILEI